MDICLTYTTAPAASSSPFHAVIATAGLNVVLTPAAAAAAGLNVALASATAVATAAHGVGIYLTYTANIIFFLSWPFSYHPLDQSHRLYLN